MSSRNIFYVMAYAGLLAPVWTAAQSVDDIRKEFPGHEAVVLNNTLDYDIRVKDGQPLVKSKQVQQLLYLSANAAAYMSHYGFTHSSFHELEGYEAYTKTPNSKKVRVTEFQTSNSSSNSIFYDDVKETTFDFPALAPGAVGTLELNMLHKDAHLLSPYYFTRSIPVINSELTIRFPKDMTVKYLLKGNDTDKIAFREDSKHGETVYHFTAKDMPAEKSYADAPDNAYYAPHVVFFIQHYKDETGKEVNYLSNLDDLYKLDYEFIKNINKTVGKDLQHIVDSLISGTHTAEEKTRRIYQWVQGHIKYVAFEEGMEGFVPRDANLVCTRRFGDCKDMSSLLTTMLKAAGVPAYYTWIGTRDIPYTYEEIPTPIVDNHMISTVLLDGKYIFLDATDPDCVFGMPSEFTQGKEALLSINDKEYKILKVPVVDKEKNTLVDSTVMQLTDRGITGHVAINLTGYYAMDLHGILNHTNEKDREKYLEDRFSRGSNKFHLDKSDCGDSSDKDRSRLTADFSLEDYAQKIGTDWYINMNLIKHYEHLEIDYPKRTMPVEFPFRFIKKYVTVLQIPRGYTVSYLPQGKSYHNDVWGFDMKYEQKDGSVVLTLEFDNDYLLLQPDQFKAWNKVLEQLFPLYKETISLSKK